MNATKQPRTYPVKGTNGLLAVRRKANYLSQFLRSEPAHYWLVVHVPTDLGIVQQNTKREAVALAQGLSAMLPENALRETKVPKISETLKGCFEKREGRLQLKGAPAA